MDGKDEAPLEFPYCQGCMLADYHVCSGTVDENFIATIKMRNNFCYTLKMVIFPTLRKQKLLLLFSLLQFLNEFCRLVPGNSCRSFMLLKVLAKSNGNLFAVAFKSKKERQLSLLR